MSTQDRDKWIHECFVENYDILVVRARRRAGNDPILAQRNRRLRH